MDLAAGKTVLDVKPGSDKEGVTLNLWGQSRLLRCAWKTCRHLGVLVCSADHVHWCRQLVVPKTLHGPVYSAVALHRAAEARQCTARRLK